MNYRPNACQQFHRAVERMRRVQAVCRWHRALGYGLGRQLFWAWRDYHSLSQPIAAYSDDADIRIPMIFSFAGLTFALFIMERFPSIVTTMSASSWLVSP